MKFILNIIISTIYLLNTSNSHSQGFLKDFDLSLGYSFQKQDRRLFDFPMRDNIIEIEETVNDYQLELTLNKNFLVLNNFSSTFGIGYSMNVNKFGRPFDHNYFTGAGTKELRRIENYTIHNLRVCDNLKYKLVGKENNNLSIIVPFGFNINLYKHIKATHGNWSEGKWNFGFNNFDVYTGLLYKSKNITFSLTYRILNFQKIDHVIFYPILTHAHVTEFLMKKYEFNYIDNFKVNIGYKF